MIRVYPSCLEGEPLEVHQTTAPTTPRAWLTENAPRLDLTDPPITLHLNGQPAALDDAFGPDDVLDIHIEPRGVGLIVAAVVAVVAAVAVAMLMPKPAKPKMQQQGKGLDLAGVDANTARIGEPIPEIFGRPPRVYPDYLVPPRSHWVSERVQVTDAFLCVGKGQYQKNLSNIYIGDTPVPSISADVSAQFFEPGADVSGVEQAQWWHSPQEVGFTNRGGSGLELETSSESDPPPTMGGATFSVSGTTITASQSFPSGWGSGQALQVIVPFPATITSANTISSPLAMAHFSPQIGDTLAVSGAGDDDNYVVSNFTPASGGTPHDPGSPSSITGSAAPTNLLFGTTHGFLKIEKGGRDFTVSLTADYATDADLVAAIASQLNSTGITAVLNQSGYVQLLEQPIYTGQPITLTQTDASDDIFGVSPVAVTGGAEQPAMPATGATIEFDGARFATGPARVAIGPAGHRYTISGTPTSSTRTVSTSAVTGFVGWPAAASRDIDVLLYRTTEQMEWTGPFTVTPPCSTATAIEIDYMFPAGLVRFSDSGSRKTLDATIFVEWREVGTAGWNSVSYSHSAKEIDAMGFTRRINLPRSMAVELRAKRTPKHGGSSSRDDIQWTGLRSLVDGAPTAYEGVTTLAVRVRSGDKVSVRAENKVWLRGITRILPTVEDPEVLEPTRDIMPAALHIWGSVGYGRNRVDMVTAQELHELWQEREDTWDYVAQSASTVKTLSNHCLKAGFAELTLDRGLIKPVRDAIRDVPQYIYSPQEFIDYPAMVTRLPAPDDVDGVDVEYVDSGTGRTETVQYRLPGDAGKRVQKISLIGVTHPVRAWRLAARHRRTLAYRRTTFKGETELQALNSSYMSYDRIQDGIPGYGQSAFVVSVRGQTLRLSEALDWNQSGALVLAFRLMDGRLTRPYGVTRGVDDYHAILDVPIPVPIHLGGDGRDPTMVYFGKINSWSHGVLVTSIKPGRNGRVTLEAVEYDQRVYVEDDRDPRGVTFLTTDVYPWTPPEVWHYVDAQPESVDVGIALLSGSHKTKEELDYGSESVDVGIALISGSHKGLIKPDIIEDSINVGISLVSGYREAAVDVDAPSESMDVEISLVGGSHEQG